MNQQNFISSKVVLISEKASEILNSFNERLDKHDDNFQNKNDFGKIILEEISNKFNMNIDSKNWLNDQHSPEWCIVEDIHIDLNQIDLKSSSDPWSFDYMAPCLRALSYIYNETLSKDINAKIETRSQDEIPSFTQAEYTTGWSMGGVIMPKNKIKTWWDKNLRNDFKNTFQDEKRKYKMNDLHGELIPHIQNLFFEENR